MIAPWPAEALEERAGDVAVACAALLTRQADWRHRRVETLTVRSHELVRRAVSVDLTVPRERREELRLSEREWIVPLGLLAKRPLVRFDLRDEADTALPLLRSAEIRTISREMLYLLFDLDLGDRDAEEAAGVDEVVELVLRPDAPAGAEVDRVLVELEATAGPLPTFSAWAARLAQGFLLCVCVDDVGRRRVLKFAYDEPIAAARRLQHFYDAPGCTEAASYHVEVAVPDELRARRTRLIDDATGQVLAEGPRDADRPALHYAPPQPAPALGRPGVSVAYGAERGRFLLPAALLAWVIAAQLGLPWLFADLGALAAGAGPAITILLSTSAVLSGLVLRSGEHPLVRLALGRFRLALVLATLCALCAAATLGFQASAAALRWIWGLSALAAATVGGILTVAAARAPRA